MFELPEFVTLARQMDDALTGKTVQKGNLGNTPHRFVWYNRTPKQFAALTRGKTVGRAWSEGKWLFLPLDPGYHLVLGECGGKLLYHPPGADVPAKYHLCLEFTDGSSMTAMTQMWGAMELYEKGKERARKYICDMRPTPDAPAFSWVYFDRLIESLTAGERKSAKGLLTQEQLIPGLGNAIAQDILFTARLHPRHPIEELTTRQRRALHRAIVRTVNAVVRRGGRYDETDLFGQPGGYVRIMDKNRVGRPCPACGHRIEKMQYLGGACYFCPHCQT
jgi:formamidopyrimidine-DNA glycosylase